MRPRCALPALALVVALAWPAGAQETPLALGSFAGAEAGTELAFHHGRSLAPSGDAAEPVLDERLVLAVAEGPEGKTVTVRPAETGAEPRLPPYPAEVGHPLILLFLESTVRTVAAATGGNPDYLRDALRQSLLQPAEPEPRALTRAGAPLEARTLAYQPFAEDPNREKMGPFAEIELGFTFSDAVPGGLVAIELATPAGEGGVPGLRETIRLEGVAGL